MFSLQGWAKPPNKSTETMEEKRARVEQMLCKKNSFVKFQNPDFTPKISKSIRRHNARRFFEISECRFYHGCLGVVHHVVSQVQEMSRYMHHNPPAYGYTKDLRALGLWCHCHSQNHKCQQTSEEPMQFWKGWKWDLYLARCCDEFKAEYCAKVRSVRELSSQVVLKSDRLYTLLKPIMEH